MAVRRNNRKANMLCSASYAPAPFLCPGTTCQAWAQPWERPFSTQIISRMSRCIFACLPVPLLHARSERTIQTAFKPKSSCTKVSCQRVTTTFSWHFLQWPQSHQQQQMAGASSNCSSGLPVTACQVSYVSAHISLNSQQLHLLQAIHDMQISRQC